MKIPRDVYNICQILHHDAYEAYVVGGAVRDSLLGREAHDWDIATNARPETVIKLFPKVIETGIKHGTVTVLSHGEGYEVTTYRGDGAYSDGRRPDGVIFLNSIEEDLARRDFTINALAYSPLEDKLVDPFGGEQDLKNRIIRAVGNPIQRFTEDGLRILRAARFAATLDFSLEESTKQATSCLETLAKVSIERVRDEWLKAMKAEKPSIAFRIMEATGMFRVIASELILMIGCGQNAYHAYDVWEHTLAVLDACPVDDPILRIAALLHDVGKPETKGINEKTGDASFYNHEVVGAEIADKICERMKFSTKERERIVHLVRYHFIRYESDWSAATIRRWVRKVGKENTSDLFTLARADIAGKGDAKTKLDVAAIDELERRISEMEISSVVLSTTALAINGKDVMERLNLSPSRKVGEILAALLERVLDNPELNNREDLLATVDIYGAVK